MPARAMRCDGQPAIASPEADRPGARRQEAEDGADRRRLAHAVAAEQRHDLARADREVDPEEHLARAIGGLEPADVEQRAHAASSSPR
jgi:hypothetical protein